ncbi:MAG: hypothetical protein ACREVI_14010 [Steroidobacteraceae bacterium]
MNPRIRSSALLLCLGFAFVASAQAAESGWYVVDFGGEWSGSGISQSRTNENLAAIFESGGLDVVDTASTLDDSDTGFGLAGGYQLNDHFVVEFAYVDLGSMDIQATVTVTDGVDVADADVGLESSAQGPVLSALGILLLGERFSLFGRCWESARSSA